MNVRQWYRIAAQADESVAKVYVYDDIGKSWWDDETVTAKKFTDDLLALPEAVKTIEVHINCYGGDMFDGVAIANALRSQREGGRAVDVVIDGIAASAASIVAMAGQKITMADNAMMMVHDPWGIVMGNARDMRKAADTFDGFVDVCVATYQWQSKLSADDIRQLMADETWLDADDAIAKGFATEKTEGLKAAATLDRRVASKLDKVPEKYRARIAALIKPVEKPDDAPVALAEIEVLRLCEEGSCLPIARELITAKATDADVKARIKAENTRAAETKTRTDAITALCKNNKVPQLAAGYISGAMSVEAVKEHLTTVTALVQKGEIDSGLDPNHDQAQVDASWKKSMTRAGRSRAAKRS